MSYEKLIEAGLKTTVQRIAILEYLENSIEHPSAEMVHNFISKKYPTVTVSTVYNTLETFVEKSIITKVFTLQGKARYDARMKKHHHLFDEKTEKLIDVFDKELNEMISNHLKQKTFKGLKINDFHINFTGSII